MFTWILQSYVISDLKYVGQGTSRTQVHFVHQIEPTAENFRFHHK